MCISILVPPSVLNHPQIKSHRRLFVLESNYYMIWMAFRYQDVVGIVKQCQSSFVVVTHNYWTSPSRPRYLSYTRILCSRTPRRIRCRDADTARYNIHRYNDDRNRHRSGSYHSPKRINLSRHHVHGVYLRLIRLHDPLPSVVWAKL